jgi:hypothetical protein
LYNKESIRNQEILKMLLDIIIMDIIYKRKYSAIPGQVPMDTWQDCVSDAVWASVRGRDYLLLYIWRFG